MKALEFREASRARGHSKTLKPKAKGGACTYEDNIIRKFYPDEAAEGCAKRMDRSIAWIRSRAYTLGVRYNERTRIAVGTVDPDCTEWFVGWLAHP